MIAVDTSALVAIAYGEPEARRFLKTLTAQDWVLGAPTALEAHQVVHGSASKTASGILSDLMAMPNLVILPFTPMHFVIAHQAGLRYGKGRGHPAKLNFGDCLTYAVAKRDHLPLLFKGNDFVHTDLTPAAP